VDSIKNKEYLKEKNLSGSRKVSLVLFDGANEVSPLNEAMKSRDLQLVSITKTNTVESLYNAVSEYNPDIVILHIILSEIDWLSLIQGIKNLKSGIKIIVYSDYLDRKFILKIMGAGVAGYVADKGSYSDIIKALDVVNKGGVYLSSEILVSPDEDQKIPALVDIDISFLSKRESDVIRLIGEGLSTKEIAFELVLSIKTVETYRRRIMEKLGIYSIAGLTKFAISAGLTNLS